MSAARYHLRRALSLARNARHHLAADDMPRALAALDHLMGTLEAALEALIELAQAAEDPSSPEARDIFEWLRAIEVAETPSDRAKAWQEIADIARDMALDEAQRAAEAEAQPARHRDA